MPIGGGPGPGATPPRPHGMASHGMARSAMASAAASAVASPAIASLAHKMPRQAQAEEVQKDPHDE
eukprot:6985788-Lingulodinium_polyedra.AAC.1